MTWITAVAEHGGPYGGFRKFGLILRCIGFGVWGFPELGVPLCPNSVESNRKEHGHLNGNWGYNRDWAL